MAKFVSNSILFTIIISLVGVAHSLYEDQVGKFDWKQRFVGKIKFAKFDTRRVIVATEENVLAGLSLKSGQIIWRHILEDPTEQQIQLLQIDREILTVSGARNSFFVRGWDPNGGSLLYEWTIYTERIVESYWSLVNGQLIHVIPIVGSHLEITIYNSRTGENPGKTTRISTPWVTDISRCSISGKYFACTSSDDSTGQLYYIDLISQNAQAVVKQIDHLIGNAPGKVQIMQLEHETPSILLIRNNVARLVHLKDVPMVQPYSFLSNVISIQNGRDSLLYQLQVNVDNPDKLLKVNWRNLETSEEASVDLDYPKGLGAPYIAAGQCKANTCDFLLSSTDSAIVFARIPEGKVIWTREEALSNIVATEFFELPVSEVESSIENEFKDSDVFTMFTNRISSQIRQLGNLIFGNPFKEGSPLVRDDFGLHKIIVVATSVGKLYAIDTLSGLTVWSYRLPQVKPFFVFNEEKMFLIVQRTARYAPLPALCTLIAEDAKTGNSVLFQFDPITGYSAKGVINLGYKIKQNMILPYENENHLRSILLVADDNNVHLYPEDDKSVIVSNAKRTYLYTIDAHKSLLHGYSLAKNADETLRIAQVWQINLAPSKIVAISTRPLTERVHSQGRVLPDRSVYYKYVNPNLIAVATIADDPVHKNVLSVYLIDGVNGLVLYSTSHKRAKGPVHLVHSENWLVYTFFNERFRRTEIAAAEMYEGTGQSNSTVFSSHAVSQLPHVQTQSYILPSTPSALTVTLTERGITSKELLVALTHGAVAEIPWALLQPRFADIPCGPEESCFPYMPEIPLPHEATINYNQTLGRVKGISVAPARLESTSHVLVYGLDLFYTRVAPSKTFDVLKEDFDHVLIILVLSGLIVASYVTKYLAAKKALRQAWK